MQIGFVSIANNLFAFHFLKDNQRSAYHLREAHVKDFSLFRGDGLVPLQIRETKLDDAMSEDEHEVEEAKDWSIRLRQLPKLCVGKIEPNYSYGR